MKNVRVEIIMDSFHDYLNERVNRWLEEHPHNEIYEIKYQPPIHRDNFHVIMIIYSAVEENENKEVRLLG